MTVETVMSDEGSVLRGRSFLLLILITHNNTHTTHNHTENYVFSSWSLC